MYTVKNGNIQDGNNLKLNLLFLLILLNCALIVIKTRLYIYDKSEAGRWFLFFLAILDLFYCPEVTLCGWQWQDIKIQLLLLVLFHIYENEKDNFQTVKYGIFGHAHLTYPLAPVNDITELVLHKLPLTKAKYTFKCFLSSTVSGLPPSSKMSNTCAGRVC